MCPPISNDTLHPSPSVLVRFDDFRRYVRLVVDAWWRDPSMPARHEQVVGYGFGGPDRRTLVVLTEDDCPEIISSLTPRLPGVDVRARRSGRFEAARRAGRFTPSYPGLQIGPDRTVQFGTLAVRARYRSGAPGDLAIASSHVVAVHGEAQTGDVILQPSKAELGALDFGVLVDWEPLEDGARIDAAILEVGRRGMLSEIDRMVRPNGHVPTDAIDEGLPLEKYGATSGVTEGEVSLTYATVRMHYPHGPVDLDEQIVSDNLFANMGDSGAPVLARSDEAFVGVIVGRNERGTVISPAEAILDRFDIELA